MADFPTDNVGEAWGKHFDEIYRLRYKDIPAARNVVALLGSFIESKGLAGTGSAGEKIIEAYKMWEKIRDS